MWAPSLYDKALESHPVLEDVAGPMLRHGVSCAAMADIFKVMLPHMRDTYKYRLPSETELRTATNNKRDSALWSVQQLRIEGKV